MCCSQFPNCSMLFIAVTFKPNKPFNPLYWILFLFLSSLTHFTLSPVLSVWCPGLHLQPLSSTSCLCKDPATAVVSIVFVQTPWCRDIHSLFPVPAEEAGGTKDYEMSFPEPFFCFIQNFFFSFVQLVLFFLPPLLLLFGNRPYFQQAVSFLIFTQSTPVSLGFFFF